MYKVDVPKIKNKLNELNNLLDIYQENYLNLYHQIQMSNEDELWVDPHAKIFYDDKVIEKSNIEESYSELNEISNLIGEIVNKYSSLGSIVEFDLTYRNSILSKFNIYNNKLNRILNSYNDLDYSFASSDIISSINEQISKVREQINLSDSLKENIISIIDDIKEYERDISRMLRRITIKKIQYVDVEKYCTADGKDNIGKSMINIEEMKNVIKKMSLYSDLENSNFLGILNLFKSIIDLYKTDNSLVLENLTDSVNNKLENIKDCNTNNIQIFTRNVDKYSSIDKDVTASAGNIGA